MPILNVSIKGQITLPVDMRRKLGIKPHDRVVLQSTEDTIIIRRAKDFFALKGFLGPAKPGEKERRDMMEAVAEHVTGGERTFQISY